MPTFGDYLTHVVATASPGATRSYASYWDHANAVWGQRRLDKINTGEIAEYMRRVQRTAVRRRNHREGRYAAEHLLRALRYVYRCARDEQLIAREDDPTRKIKMPRRLPSTRRALTGGQLADIALAVYTTGREPVLDGLILRLHIETACRVAGARKLRIRDLDRDLCLVLLREKFGTHRWQPVSPTLMAALYDHATQRGAHRPDDLVLRTRRGEPITRSRYDSLWKRVHHALAWTATQQVSSHWLRHTTLTWVERHFGYGVARDFAGHTDSKGASTTTYIRAVVEETATALSAMTGEQHPLDRTSSRQADHDQRGKRRRTSTAKLAVLGGAEVADKGAEVR
jgi:integrase